MSGLYHFLLPYLSVKAELSKLKRNCMLHLLQ
uniref:Uncharacterized protein n=1 Tax=Arundo donax TaxID=35708 RepID=A0A0A9U204_ARUDO